jgi:dTDP-L-rhamnose 4-epimerase
VVRDVARVLGVGGIEPKVTAEFRTGDVRHCYADVERCRTMLGFVPTSDWDLPLAETIAWAKAAPALDRFDVADDELRSRGLLR